jgi:hypothetical protein
LLWIWVWGNNPGERCVLGCGDARLASDF